MKTEISPIIYVQSPTQALRSRILSAEELMQRREEVRAWALSKIEEGRNLDPRVFSGENRRVFSPDGNGPVSGAVSAPLGGINFLEAADLDEAVAIAKTHPALRYGISIEIAEWASPLAQG